MRSNAGRSSLLCVFLRFIVLVSCSFPMQAQVGQSALVEAPVPMAAPMPQAAPPTRSAPIPDYEFTCPGSFPSDLTIVNCKYTGRQRLEQFVTTGVTDQAMLLSITGSLFTQALKTPGEWPRTWKYYGYRVGASYSQSLGSASSQLIVGAIVRDDPRHVPCNGDPLLFNRGITDDQPFTCSKWHRLGHALLDSITERKSDAGTLTPLVMIRLGDASDMDDASKKYKKLYRRFPAFTRLVGAYAGAYSQYPWEPASANKFGAVSQRAALSFAPTFLGSFYTEYGSSLFSLFKRGKK